MPSSLSNKTKVISAKDLGKLALPDFCPRCFWLERHFGKPPSLFPSIFSSIDSLTKKNVHETFSKEKRIPAWLPLEKINEVYDGDVSFKLPVEAGDWVLVGRPDDIFQMEDKSFQIVDYKTAKFTGRQDELFPLYAVQLNAYAFLAEKYGLEPVSKLSLVYCEPSEAAAENGEFVLKFKSYHLNVGLDQENLFRLLVRAREIVDLAEPPASAENCQGICRWLDKIANQDKLSRI